MMQSASNSRLLGGWSRFPLTALAAAIIVATTAVGAVHIGDRYRIDTASGARVALARYFDEGTLYPPLYDGEKYGGTRFMPLPLVLHGVAAKITGEYLTSGKALAYAAMFGVLALTLLLLRKHKCPWPLAIALTAIVLATESGMKGTMSLRADSLALLLQLGAISMVVGRQTATRDSLAALLAAGAFIAELSAIWALLAIVVHLWLLDRRRSARFLMIYVIAAAGVFGVAAIASEGRIVTNVLGLAGAGIQGPSSLVVAPYRFLTLLIQEALAAVVLLPLAVVAIIRELRAGRPSVTSWSLVFCAIGITFVLTDIGTGWNQLVDFVVLEVLVVGVMAGIIPDSERTLSYTIVAATLGAGVLGGATVVVPASRDALSAVRDPSLWSAHPLPGEGIVLSEDPYVPVSMGQDPVVLDPFMLLRIGNDDPGAVEDLVRRIEAREFDLVLLTTSLEPPDQDWWRNYHFGTAVTEAIARAYSPVGRTQGYWLYEPTVGGG